ncbi:MAG: hypothetical protein ACTSXX_06095 [Candidatus Baldrarchaeia archaeon]
MGESLKDLVKALKEQVSNLHYLILKIRLFLNSLEEVIGCGSERKGKKIRR